jgi:hypothetical protein
MNSSQIFYLLHVYLIGPLFISIGLLGDKSPLILYNLLGFLSLFVVFFHSYVIYYKYTHKKDFTINLIHIFFLAPIMYLVAYTKPNDDFWYRILLLLGIVNIVYHGMKSIRNDILDLSYLDPIQKILT